MRIIIITIYICIIRVCESALVLYSYTVLYSHTVLYIHTCSDFIQVCTVGMVRARRVAASKWL